MRPIEALFPGVTGKVLGVLARTEIELSMRSVAQLAGVSPQQASVVLATLVGLGVVTRREVPPAALVALAADNLAAQSIRSLLDLRERVLRRLTELADDIVPAPASLVVFGSFARGTASAYSDVDVVAVRPDHVSGDDPQWGESLGHWQHAAGQVVGNPVNIVEVGVEEMAECLAGPASSFLHEAADRGIVLLGEALPRMAVA